MHAVLRQLGSADLGADSLDSYVPPNPDDFGTVLSAHVGPSDQEGEELFYVTVCSPTWLAGNAMRAPSKGFPFVRATLLVDAWDPVVIHRAIADLCSRTSGSDWSEIANKLSRYLAWEFEDYTP